MPNLKVTVDVELVSKRPRLAKMLVRISRIVLEATPFNLRNSVVDVFGWILFHACYEMKIGGVK